MSEPEALVDRDRSECTRRDLNPHALRRRNLKATGGDGRTAADVVEVALADALTRAAAAGQWTTVEVLSRELTARREARAAVVDLGVTRAKRERW